MYLILVNDFDELCETDPREPRFVSAQCEKCLSSFFLSFFSFYFLHCFEIRATERDLFVTFSMTSAELTLFSACYHMFST